MLRKHGKSPSANDMVTLPKQTAAEMSRVSATDPEAENVTAPPVCVKCDKHIYDGTILKVRDEYWHNSCLQCAVCRKFIHGYCYAKDGQMYCAIDFTRLFGTKCANCTGIIAPTEAVRVANGNVYHCACFVCSVCGLTIESGDSFYLREDRKLLCKNDYLRIVEIDDVSHKNGNIPRQTTSSQRQETTNPHDVSRETTRTRQPENSCQWYCPLDYLIPDGMPPNIDLSSTDILDGEVVPSKQNIACSFEGNFPASIVNDNIALPSTCPSVRTNLQTWLAQAV